jgi:hypothetical protein
MPATSATSGRRSSPPRQSSGGSSSSQAVTSSAPVWTAASFRGQPAIVTIGQTPPAGSRPAGWPAGRPTAQIVSPGFVALQVRGTCRRETRWWRVAGRTGSASGSPALGVTRAFWPSPAGERSSRGTRPMRCRLLERQRGEVRRRPKPRRTHALPPTRQRPEACWIASGSVRTA